MSDCQTSLKPILTALILTIFTTTCFAQNPTNQNSTENSKDNKKLAIRHELPAPVLQELQRLQIDPNHLSLVITPIGQKNKGKLPLTEQASLLSTATPPNPQPNHQANPQPSQPIHAKPKPTIEPIVLDDGTIINPIYNDEIDNDTPNNHTTFNQNSPKPNPSPTQALPYLNYSIQHFANLPRTPASTMKLIPTFIALDSLGADFVWKTKVFYTGAKVGNTLYGNLVIQGSGDPKLTEAHLKQLLYQVKKTGIEHIKGDIILDTSVFQQVSKDPAEFDNDPLRPYNASPDGLLVNFSTITIRSLPSSHGQASLIYSPKLADYYLPESIPQRVARCGKFKYSLAPEWQKTALVFHNKLPTACGSREFYIAYPNGKEFAIKVIKALWQDMGNSLTGTVKSQEKPWQSISNKPQGLHTWRGTLLPIAIEPSYPLAEQIYDINHHSNNVMTEQVMLSLPVYHTVQPQDFYPNKPFSNYPKSIHYVNNWWQQKLTSPPPHMTNGSGLCRECTVTANNLNELLDYAYQSPEFDHYLNSLGIAGVSGTIITHKYRRPNSQAIGRAWIKTGTLDNVAAMAGYVKGQSGQDYSVVGIINDDRAGVARPVLDAMLDWTAGH